MLLHRLMSRVCWETNTGCMSVFAGQDTLVTEFHAFINLQYLVWHSFIIMIMISFTHILLDTRRCWNHVDSTSQQRRVPSGYMFTSDNGTRASYLTL